MRKNPLFTCIYCMLHFFYWQLLATTDKNVTA